jgi:hypothetical protein
MPARGATNKECWAQSGNLKSEGTRSGRSGRSTKYEVFVGRCFPYSAQTVPCYWMRIWESDAETKTIR